MTKQLAMMLKDDVIIVTTDNVGLGSESAQLENVGKLSIIPELAILQNLVVSNHPLDIRPRSSSTKVIHIHT